MAEKSLNYAYNYAVINLTTGMCTSFQSSTLELTEEELAAHPNWIPIDVNDPEYLGKYYINGAWYKDAAGTIPWESSLV